MSSMFPSSVVGLSSNLDYKLPPSMAENSRCYSVAIAPDGQTSVSGSAPLALYVANNSPVNAFNSQTISFTIPSGNSRSVYLDPKETYLSFRLALNITTASNVTGPVGGPYGPNLIGSGQSFFDQLVLYSNNVPIETVNQYGLLSNMLLNSTVSQSERQGAVSIGMGSDSDSANGINLYVNTGATGVLYYNFCIPLISVIGINGSDKLFPIGAISNLQLQMVTASLFPMVSFCTTVTAAGVATATLDNFSLNLKYIDIGSAQSLVDATIPDGKIFIKSQTWVTANSNLPSGTAGQVNAFYQIRNSSVKSVLFQNSQATAAATLNGYYDANNYGVTLFNASINGMNYPQTPLNPSNRPGQCWLAFLSALGLQGNYKNLSGSIGRSAYGATLPSLTGLGNVDVMLVVPAAGVRATSGIETTVTQPLVQFPNSHYLGIDTEKNSGVLFQGINTRAGGIQGNFFISTTNGITTAVTSFGFGLIDAVLMIDVNSQTIQAFV